MQFVIRLVLNWNPLECDQVTKQQLRLQQHQEQAVAIGQMITQWIPSSERARECVRVCDLI